MQKEITPPFINGLQKGKVIQLQNDPLGEFRVLISLTGTTAKTPVWATLVCWDAGSKRGSFFYPEIGDDVIAGYINNDPGQPVILGSYYSKRNPPAVLPEDTNRIKKYTSRSGTEIVIDDQEKILSLKTPAGNTIMLNEKENSIEIKDQNYNKIMLNNTGISVESPVSISIKAATHLVFDAAESISINGKSVFIKASGELKAEASNALLKADGVTEIKGAAVKIN